MTKENEVSVVSPTGTVIVWPYVAVLGIPKGLMVEVACARVSIVASALAGLANDTRLAAPTAAATAARTHLLGPGLLAPVSCIDVPSAKAPGGGSLGRKTCTFWLAMLGSRRRWVQLVRAAAP
jgi:hypothetical protein